MRLAAWVMGVVVFMANGVLAADEKPVAKERVEQKQVQEEGQKAQKAVEIERGVWLRSTFGMSTTVINVFSGGQKQKSSVWPLGTVMGIELGFDLGQIASLFLAFAADHLPGSRETSRGSVGNDAAAFLGMGGVRFSLMTTKRLSWYVKAAAGYLLSSPELATLDNGILVQGGTGLEYATKLRHFYLGLEASGQFLVAGGGLMVVLTPTLKYVF
jgi:hypothetical protein